MFLFSRLFSWVALNQSRLGHFSSGCCMVLCVACFFTLLFPSLLVSCWDVLTIFFLFLIKWNYLKVPINYKH